MAPQHAPTIDVDLHMYQAGWFMAVFALGESLLRDLLVLGESDQSVIDEYNTHSDKLPRELINGRLRYEAKSIGFLKGKFLKIYADARCDMSDSSFERFRIRRNMLMHAIVRPFSNYWLSISSPEKMGEYFTCADCEETIDKCTCKDKSRSFQTLRFREPEFRQWLLNDLQVFDNHVLTPAALYKGINYSGMIAFPHPSEERCDQYRIGDYFYGLNDEVVEICIESHTYWHQQGVFTWQSNSSCSKA